MLNRIELIGHLGDDPKEHVFNDQSKIAKVSMAVTDKWTDSQGNKREKTDWFNLVFSGKQADTVLQYLHKGAKIFVEGKLSTRSWESNGVTQYGFDVIAKRFIFLDKVETQTQ